MAREPLITVVDDDASIRDTLKDLLESAGFSAATFPDAAAFLNSKQRQCAACVVADLRMPGMTGLELHAAMVASGHAIPTILISAYADDRVRTRALKEGVVCCLTKPLGAERLLGCIHQALAMHKVREIGSG